MKVETLRQWAKTIRLHTWSENPDDTIPQTKQDIFDAVLGELVFLDDYEWGPLTQMQVDKYCQIRKRFMEADE